jgi:hypothetical protein
LEKLTLSENPTPAAEKPKATHYKAEGLPLWMPLLGLVIAFLFALFVGARICPTLSAVVQPPDPPLPPGDSRLLLHESKGAGSDEWLYATTVSGCVVAKYYETRLGECTYDPDASCSAGSSGQQPIPGSSSYVAQCHGKQAVGAYQVLWTVYISTNYPEKETTHFRVFREAGN